MNQFQEKKIVNYINLARYLDTHKVEFSKDGDILKIVNVFLARLDSIQQELLNISAGSNEITTELTLARNLLIKLCNKISIQIQHYAKENDFSMLKRSLYVDFHSLSDSELFDFAKELLLQIEEVENTTSDFKLQNSDLNSLKNLIDNLRQIIQVPGMMFKFRAKTSAAFDENIEENEKLLMELNTVVGKISDKSINIEYAR